MSGNGKKVLFFLPILLWAELHTIEYFVLKSPSCVRDITVLHLFPVHPTQPKSLLWEGVKMDRVN